MHHSFPIIPIIITLLLLTTPTLAQPQAIVDEVFANTTFDVAAGLGLHYWKPGLDGNLVDFDSEGLKAWWVEGSVSVMGMPFTTVHVVRPLVPSSEQNEMVQVLRDNEVGLSEFLGTVDFMPLVLHYLNQDTGQSNWLESILSVRISYYRDLYYGRTNNREPFAYFPMGSGVDFSAVQPDPYGYSVFEAGQNLRFKTLFQDVHIMIPILTEDAKKGNVLHLGVFRSQWEKAVENTYYMFEDLPIIQDSELVAKGLSISVNFSAEENGIGLRGGGDLGLVESSMKTAIDIQEELEDNQGIIYAAAFGEIRLQKSLKSGPRPIQLVLGLRGETRSWKVQEQVNVGADGSPRYKTVKRLDKDLLYQVFATLRARF